MGKDTVEDKLYELEGGNESANVAGEVDVTAPNDDLRVVWVFFSGRTL